MHSTEKLIENLRARGGKVTPQRLLIYQLLEGDTTHPTAEAIYERVREVMPTVSLTTVYKTLNELVAIGELRRFDVHGVSHFDPNTAPHAEVVCLGCNSIVDVPYASMPEMPELPKVADFRLVGQTQTFYGYCARCEPVTDDGDGEPGRTLRGAS